MTFEEQFGIKVSVLAAGLVGGIVSLTFEQKISAVRAVMLILTGCSTAVYVHPLIESYYNTSPDIGPGISFILSLLSMRIIKRVLDAVDKVPLSTITSRFFNGFTNDKSSGGNN